MKNLSLFKKRDAKTQMKESSLNKILTKRFSELQKELEDVAKTKYFANSQYTDGEYLKAEALTKWKIKVKSLIDKLCGQDSDYYKDFVKAEKVGPYQTNFNAFNNKLKPIFMALKEDHENGYLISIKTLIQAEVFENELQQAEELLKNGYHMASAVIAGVVLETGLRELCDRENITHGKLDKMNSDLVKAGVYNKLLQKKITALADIRNNAAHGKSEEFTIEDVKIMIRDIEQFLAKELD